MTFQIRRPKASSRVSTSIGTMSCTCASKSRWTREPCFIAGVLFILPYLVNEYQYCSSHHAGDTISVTESGFIGGFLKRSSGDLLSSTSSSFSTSACTSSTVTIF